MASGDSDKTEKPTPKKIKEARKEGTVARSQDVSAWLGLLAATVILPMLGRKAADLLETLLFTGMTIMKDPTPEGAVKLLGDGLHGALLVWLPLGGVTVLVAVAATGMQGGVHLATKKPTRALFTSILAPSHRACGPNSRLAPWSGLSRDHFGLSALVAKNSPPWATAPSTLMTSTSRPRHTESSRISRPPSPSRSRALSADGRAIMARVRVSSAWTDSIPLPASRSSIIATTSTAAHGPTSGDRATCPSLRLFFRFWGVACSVFSSVLTRSPRSPRWPRR
jgi:hypothetical protein